MAERLNSHAPHCTNVEHNSLNCLVANLKYEDRCLNCQTFSDLCGGNEIHCPCYYTDMACCNCGRMQPLNEE